MIEADTTWLTDNFEELRIEVLQFGAINGMTTLTCLRCAAYVPRYGAAWHLKWHEQLGDGAIPAKRS